MDATQDSITRDVTDRFFHALQALKDLRLIRGKQSFTDCYGINRWNLNSVQKGGASQKYAQIAWLSLISRDCGVSARWLLTGEGAMFDREPSPPVRQEGAMTEYSRRASRRDGNKAK